MLSDKRVMCECGQPATAEYQVWNGKEHLPVCIDCWHDPENIILEACVSFAEGGLTLEEALRVELGFREQPYTPTLQVLADRRYLEWYVEA